MILGKKYYGSDVESSGIVLFVWYRFLPFKDDYNEVFIKGKESWEPTENQVVLRKFVLPNHLSFEYKNFN